MKSALLVFGMSSGLENERISDSDRFPFSRDSKQGSCDAGLFNCVKEAFLFSIFSTDGEDENAALYWAFNSSFGSISGWTYTISRLREMSFSEEKLSDVSFLTDVFAFNGLAGRDCKDPLGDMDLINDEDFDDPITELPSELCSGDETEMGESVAGENFLSDSGSHGEKPS